MSDVVFGRAAPTLHVTNMEEALSLWEGVLGFVVSFRNGDPLSFAIVKSGDAEIHLTLRPGHVGSEHNVAHLLVSNADVLWERLTAKALGPVTPMRDVTPTMKGFVFTDADGNRVDVGEKRS